MSKKASVTDHTTDSVTVADSAGNTLCIENGDVSWVELENPISPSKLKSLVSFAKAEYVKHCTTL